MHRENMVELDVVTPEIIVDIVVKIKEKLGEKKIKPETVSEIIKDIIELVEKRSLDGETKRIIAIKVLKNLIDDLVEDENDKNLMNEMIDKKIITNTIDLIILASKGKLDINNPETKKKAIKLGKSLLPLILNGLLKLVSCLKKEKSSSENIDVKNVEVIENN